MSQWVEDVTEVDFQRLVIERSREVPIVVDFWAPWCGPCKELGPVLEGLAGEYGGAFLLVKVNCDESPNLMMALQIQSIPLVIAFRDGQPTQHFMGNLPADQVRAWLQQALPGLVPAAAAAPEPEPDVTETLSAEEAEAHYRDLLAVDEHDQAALLGLARLMVDRGANEEAAHLLDHVRPNEETDDEVEQLQAVLALHQLAAPFGSPDEARQRLAAEPDSAERRYELGCALAGAAEYDSALSELLSAAQADLELARGKAKEAMVQVFYAIGSRSELSDRYRQRLTMLLY